MNDQDVGPERRKFGSMSATTLGAAAGEARFDRESAPLPPAETPKLIPKRRDPAQWFGIVFGQRHEHADQAPRLLGRRTG